VLLFCCSYGVSKETVLTMLLPYEQGKFLETHCEGDWWETQIVRLQGGSALVHYVGGHSEEDEWIPLESIRFRQPQASANNLPIASMADSQDSAGSDRPMRRSRMLSDDARFALQLQDEELKAARGMKRPKSAAPPPTKHADAGAGAKKAKTPASEKPAGASAKVDVAPPAHGKGGRGGKATAVNASGRGGAAGKSKAVAAGASQSNSSRAPPKAERGAKAPAKSPPPPSDAVSFTLEPWPSAQEDVAPLRSSRMTLQEDQTVLMVKRRLVEEVYPGTDVSKVEIRTESGIKCGQDHSLKYVRTFLWPPSKGDLVLFYCQAADSFL